MAPKEAKAIIKPKSGGAGERRCSRGEDHRHDEPNKLVSKLEAGEASSHLDVGGLSDTNQHSGGKEKAKSS